jgi:hypothetical protein
MLPHILTLKFGAPSFFYKILSFQWEIKWTSLSKLQFWTESLKMKMYFCFVSLSNSKACSFRCDSPLQWPSTKHKDNRYKYVNQARTQGGVLCVQTPPEMFSFLFSYFLIKFWCKLLYYIYYRVRYNIILYLWNTSESKIKI